ncbi:MAG: GTP-binding protein [Rhodospirillaceae bacterium]|nr:GTP-binding protein [Rhodospirillaceae bacterium]
MTTQGTPKVNQIPALLLTGFLGAGKTTLLRALLSSPDAADTAVIVNEFGEIGLDHHLLVGASETMYLLENGCVCCTQRDDLEASLEDLYWARLRRKIPWFSRVIVETTGLADPSGVFAMVSGDPLAGIRYVWQSVVTLVDGVNGSETLEAHAAAAQQAAMADHLIISKTDLAADIGDLRRRLQILNSDARLHQASRGALGASLDALMQPAPGADARRLGLSGGPLHDAGITSCWLHFRPSLPRLEFDAAFADLTEKFGVDLLRAKGIAHFAGDPKPSVLQYVAGGTIEITPADLAADAPAGLVVIASKVSPGEVENIFVAHGLGPYLVAEDHKGHAH